MRKPGFRWRSIRATAAAGLRAPGPFCGQALRGRSEARYVARDRLAPSGRKLLHDFHHVGIVGPITLGKAAHRLDQGFEALTGEPPPRGGASERPLMTKLSAGRRAGSAATR